MEDIKKEPPELVIPPPPSATPPPDTPDTLQGTNTQPDHDTKQDTPNIPDIQSDLKLSSSSPKEKSTPLFKSSSSLQSSYEDLVIPIDGERTVIRESDFEDGSILATSNPSKTSYKSGSTRSNLSSKSLKSDDGIYEKATSVKSEEVFNSSANAEVKNDSYENKGSTSEVKSSVSSELANHDVSEPLDLSLRATPEQMFIDSQENASSDKENEDEEKQLSVKEILELAKQKELEARGNTKISNWKNSQDNKKYLSTDSESDSHERRKSGESNDTPPKPPRKKSPIRDMTRSRDESRGSTPIHQSPVNDDSSQGRGLKPVNSPILKLLSDADNYEEEEVTNLRYF